MGVSDGSINIPSGANTIMNCSESNSSHMKGKFEVQRFFIITLHREIAKLQKKKNKKEEITGIIVCIYSLFIDIFSIKHKYTIITTNTIAHTRYAFSLVTKQRRDNINFLL